MTWFQTQTLVTVMYDSLFSLLWMWVCCWIKVIQSGLMMTLRRPLSKLLFITLAETKEVERWWQHLISAMKRDATQSLPELVTDDHSSWICWASCAPIMAWQFSSLYCSPVAWMDGLKAVTAHVAWRTDAGIFWQNIYAFYVEWWHICMLTEWATHFNSAVSLFL